MVANTSTQWYPPDHRPRLTSQEEATIEKMLQHFKDNPFQVEIDDGFFGRFDNDVERTQRLFSLLETQCKVIRLSEGLYISQADLKRSLEVVESLGRDGQEIRVGDVRKQLDTTRKYAMPLMQYFDHQGITQRTGDRRVLRDRSEEVSAHD